MGIRMDQFIGLPPAAEALLREYEISAKVCECCKRPFPRDLEEIGHYYGMFDQQYPLHRHLLRDGRLADEFLQASPWDCGPMFFLGLQLSDGTRFEWSEDEMDQETGCTAAEASTDVGVEDEWQEGDSNGDSVGWQDDNIIDAEFKVKS